MMAELPRLRLWILHDSLMLHGIITILTTTAVAIHATLGCCAHHAHACESHEPALAVTHESEDHCDHANHHHNDESAGESHRSEFGGDCDHQHHGGQPQNCDEGECSFSAPPRSSDIELMLTFSMWCHALGDAAHVKAIDALVALNVAAASPPDPLSASGAARAFTQVWRL